MSFDIKGDEKVHQSFLNALKLVTHAVSLGDIESLIVYYDKKSDKLPHYPEIYRQGFFRFSIGLEEAQDIVQDLQQAFRVCGLA
jgi:cystathionine beta-lyase/cystathionine gamma-synthase